MPTLKLDLANRADLEKKLNAINPSVIFNAAAYTAVDKAESEDGLAFEINANAPAIFANYAKKHDIYLNHYSTDYVFPGDNSTPWSEDSQTAPLGVYGESKLMGESSIEESGCKFMIFRTAWVFSSRGHNFLNTMLKLAQTHKELSIVDDQVGSPTWAYSLASASTQCLLNPEPGIYHMTNSGKTSWCGFAKKIFSQAKKLNLIDFILEVHPIGTKDYPTPAKRPEFSVLNCEKIKNTFNITMPSWQTALLLCMQNLQKKP